MFLLNSSVHLLIHSRFKDNWEFENNLDNADNIVCLLFLAAKQYKQKQQ